MGMCIYISSPVVAQVHTIRVEHWYDFKDHVITQDLCHWVLAHQEVNNTYTHISGVIIFK